MPATETMTLTEFLLARIAEDEEIAGQPELMWPSSWTPRFRDYEALRDTKPRDFAFGRYNTQWNPARVLAECESKRRILDWATYSGTSEPEGDGETILRLLALPYADHPDYDDSWRP